MAKRDVLIMALTRMRAGVCAAGFIKEPGSPHKLRWVRLVREADTVLPSDVTDVSGTLISCGDVVSFNLLQSRRRPPHIEDWITDFVYQRPVILRHLEEKKRRRLLETYLDTAPEEVLLQQNRSLCLVHPQDVWAQFSLDKVSGKLEARMGFTLADHKLEPRIGLPRGIPVTDLKWRALGHSWLAPRGGRLRLGKDELKNRLGTDIMPYLAVGLGRPYQGRCWPLVVGVHVVPDYEMEVLDADIAR